MESIDASDHASQILELRLLLGQVSDLALQLKGGEVRNGSSHPMADGGWDGPSEVTLTSPLRSRGKAQGGSGTPSKQPTSGSGHYGNVWARDVLGGLIEQGLAARESLKACLEGPAARGAAEERLDGGWNDAASRGAMGARLAELEAALKLEVRIIESSSSMTFIGLYESPCH